MSLISLERFLKVKIAVIFIWGGRVSEVKFHESVLAFHHGDLILPSLPRAAFLSALSPQPKKCEIV